MKQQSKLLLSLLHGVGVGAAAMSGTALVSTDAVAGISNTLHNLGNAAGTGNRVTGGATTEICVFCHTPHGSDTSTTAQGIPLWNKSIPNTTYTTYASFGSSSLDAAGNGGSTTTGSISLACLSCHDGTQAMDNIINAPGSQQLDTTGGGATGRTGTIWNWATGVRTDTNGVMNGGATNAALIGSDLRNDHPIGIQYCGGFSATPTANSTAGCRDGDFKAIQVASGTPGNSDAQYYVEASANTSRDKSDMMLYTRSFGGTFRPSVECGSCHDPHVETKATNQVAFLRVSQAASGLCLSCHNK